MHTVSLRTTCVHMRVDRYMLHRYATLSVCMYVSMYVCLSVCMYTHVYAYAYVFTNASMAVCAWYLHSGYSGLWPALWLGHRGRDWKRVQDRRLLLAARLQAKGFAQGLCGAISCLFRDHKIRMGSYVSLTVAF